MKVQSVAWREVIYPPQEKKAEEQIQVVHMEITLEIKEEVTLTPRGEQVAPEVLYPQGGLLMVSQMLW